MKTNFSKIILVFVGTMIYLFLLVPIFVIWIPYEILSASGNDIEFSKGVFQYVGFVFIALGLLLIFGVQEAFYFMPWERRSLLRQPKNLWCLGVTNLLEILCT